MKKPVIWIILIMGLIGCILLASATDFTPQGNINLRNIYNITNGTGIYSTNIYFGQNLGTFGETKPNRPLTSNADRSVTVCSSGCTYSTVQSAIDDVPFILRHQYTVNIRDGNYSEDVYVPPLVTSATTNTEGSCCTLEVIGNQSDMNGVRIKSLQVSGITGTWGAIFNYINFYGQEPRSD